MAGAAGAVVAITVNVAASPDLLIRGGETTFTPWVAPSPSWRFDKTGIGTARIAAGLRQLVRELTLKLLSLLLLALRGLLLPLELHLLRLQLRCLRLEVGRLGLQLRRLHLQVGRLLDERLLLAYERDGVGRERRSLSSECDCTVRDADLLLAQTLGLGEQGLGRLAVRLVLLDKLR